MIKIGCITSEVFQGQLWGCSLCDTLNFEVVSMGMNQNLFRKSSISLSLLCPPSPPLSLLSPISFLTSQPVEAHGRPP